MTTSEASLFVNLLVDDLKEYAYHAEMAGIEYKISHDVYAVQVSLPCVRGKEREDRWEGGWKGGVEEKKS